MSRAGQAAAFAGFLLSALLLAACGPLAAPARVLEREGEPAVISVEGDDPEMTAAIAQAQATLDQFIADLQAPKQGQTYFSIKARFAVPGGQPVTYEHMWLYNVSYGSSEFTGQLGNEPVHRTDLVLDQTLTVPRADVTDWMIIQDGVLVGGYSVRLLRSRLSAAEREQFDREAGFIIED